MNLTINHRLWTRLAAVAAMALVGAACGEVRAADPVPAPVPAPAAPPSTAAPAAPAKDAPPAAGAKGADGKSSPLHFEPTEKTRADFEVSFPTDI